MTIIDNFKRISEKVHETAINCGRNPHEIRIIAVSKTFGADIIQEAINSGINLFGENRVQEALTKFSSLTGNYELHMIGHLQSNKSRDAVRLFDMIQTIDKISTAEKLNEEADKCGKIQRVLLQLKTTDEVTKSGSTSEQLFDLAYLFSTLKNLKLEGLMSIGPNTDDKKLIEKSFIETSKTLDKLNSSLKTGMTELSMGMSGDYTIAIKEGATMIRIGSAIFGGRYLNR